jgi:hypothetical protein
MRLPFPGPGAALGAATAAATVVKQALGLVPRATDALARAEALLDRMDALANRAEKVVDRAEAATDRTHTMLDTAELVTRDAGRAVDGATGVLDRVDTSLTAWEPALRRLAPAAQRFADGLAGREVTAAIALADRMPLVLEHLEQDVLPMFRQLDRVGPDLHEILEIVEDLRRLVTGLPGVGLLRRRGDDEPPRVEQSVHDGQSSS